MSESYTIGVSPKLIRHLLDDGKKEEKKKRKPKPKINRSETVDPLMQLSDNSNILPPTPDQKHSDTLHSSKQLSDNPMKLPPTPDQKLSETLDPHNSKTTLPPTPDEKPAKAETLDAILPVLDRIEKVVERLQKQKEDTQKSIEKVVERLQKQKEDTQKANDLDSKEFKHQDPALVPSLNEKDVSSKCNNENTCKDSSKCTGLVEGFAEGRRMFREKVGILKEFLDRFRGN